ncbi:acetyl-CoA synthetase-like protein [Aspergillus steynii IBT 23096]|uniref:Acetyl-CoA synthetase-like protein n=1 Tax=Aspergillus steynii IBT 23096 TaxID=1392250 RepID=A0A2I2G836_9EURO|nr:acetyl-CoA synthetase-like protein [Aspergillus steynii IBT 23096]PLB49028.1 acetyl-CoA synthetase-like protein [Aspergillus steynii IBT 23096]
MTFQSPSWVPPIPGPIPDSTSVGEFVLTQSGCSTSLAGPNTPFVDGVSGLSYTIEVLRERVENLSRSLAARLNWSPTRGSPWEKVVAIHSVNTVDFFVLCWAIHRLNGICLPIHPTTSVDEITSHLAKANCTTIFTHPRLASTTWDVAQRLSIPSEKVFMLSLAGLHGLQTESPVSEAPCLEQLVLEGTTMPPIPGQQWAPGQGKEQVAFLCSTSGTSGKQKLAMLTHYGIITNLLQIQTFEQHIRQGRSEVVTGSVPFTHSYGILLGHLIPWRGDSLVVFPQFDLQQMLQAVSRYRIQRLYLVPPILAALAASPALLQLYDLSSVTSVLTGAAPLDRSLAQRLSCLQPAWAFLHVFGLTETCIMATCTSWHDVWLGSSGSLLPEFQLRLLGPNDEVITSYGVPGEICFMSPSLFVGYLGDEEATKQTFDRHGWLRTGDLGCMQRGPLGTEHLFIVDRIKDMIKVKGLQVIPATIESILLQHPGVHDAAVIGIADSLAGERPLAFIVRSPFELSDVDEEDFQEMLDDYVQERLEETHWLCDRILFVQEIPRSANGKLLRRELRAMMPLN